MQHDSLLSWNIPGFSKPPQPPTSLRFIYMHMPPLLWYTFPSSLITVLHPPSFFRLLGNKWSPNTFPSLSPLCAYTSIQFYDLSSHSFPSAPKQFSHLFRYEWCPLHLYFHAFWSPCAISPLIIFFPLLYFLLSGNSIFSSFSFLSINGAPFPFLYLSCHTFSSFAISLLINFLPISCFSALIILPSLFVLSKTSLPPRSFVSFFPASQS